MKAATKFLKHSAGQKKLNGRARFKKCKQWQTAALKVNKNDKRYTKAPPPSYFA
jgi:hypothetical protein